MDHLDDLAGLDIVLARTPRGHGNEPAAAGSAGLRSWLNRWVSGRRNAPFLASGMGGAATTPGKINIGSPGATRGAPSSDKGKSP